MLARKLAIVGLAALVGCVAEAEESEVVTTPPQEEQEPTPPAPMAVDIDWNGGGFDVVEIMVRPSSFGGGAVALQLLLNGSVTAPGGSTMKLQINHGTGSWETATHRSSDYTAGSCGSWQMSEDLLFGHICSAPGAPSESVTTNWTYSTAELFEVVGTPDAYSYEGTFHIRVLDGVREIECGELVLEVSRNVELGGSSSFDNGPCGS